MVLQVPKLVIEYDRVLEYVSKKYPEFSDSLQKKLADALSIPKLSDQKTSIVTTLDGLYKRFILKNVNPTILLRRLDESGYRITQPDENKNVVKAKKGKLAVLFDLRGYHPELLISIDQPEAEVKSFVKKLNSKFYSRAEPYVKDTSLERLFG